MKQNVLRKNLLLNENNIDIGNVDPIFEAENLKGLIIYEHPYIEILEGSDEYKAYIKNEAKEKEQIEIESKKQAYIDIRKSYLFKTDYYLIKSYESGEKVNENIAKKRQQARDEINTIPLIKTEKQLTKLDNTIFTITTTI